MPSIQAIPNPSSLIRSARFFSLPAVLGALLVLASCARPAPRAPERLDVRPESVMWSPRALPPAEYLPTSGTLTLEHAIETAIQNNPSLRAEYVRFEAMLLEVPQVSSLPDPMAMGTYGADTLVGGSEGQRFGFGVSQTFPWPGKLDLRGQLAESRARAAFEEYRVALLDVRLQVMSAWYRLGAEQADMELVQEDLETQRQVLENVATLYRAGQRTRQALLKAQTEVARTENALLGYPARIERYRKELDRLMGVHEMTYYEVASLEPETAQPVELADADLLFAEALSHRPELRRFSRQIEQGEISYEIARHNRHPEFTLGLEYMRNSAMADPNELDLTAGINIPIPNARRRAERQQALKQQEEARYRLAATEDEIHESIYAIMPRLRTLTEQLTVLSESLLPLAEESFEAAQSDYRTGRATLLDLLDAQRTHIGVRRELVQTLRDYRLAVAELERAAGGPLLPYRLDEVER